VSFNILFENKNYSKTIRVTWYLYKMMFSHWHLTRIIMGGKVSGFVWFHIIFLEFRSFVLNNKILKINSTAWCWWNRLGTRGIYIALFNFKMLKRYLRTWKHCEYGVHFTTFSTSETIFGH
jgi:hypothetical protein